MCLVVRGCLKEGDDFMGGGKDLRGREQHNRSASQ